MLWGQGNERNRMVPITWPLADFKFSPIWTLAEATLRSDFSALLWPKTESKGCSEVTRTRRIQRYPPPDLSPTFNFLRFGTITLTQIVACYFSGQSKVRCDCKNLNVIFWGVCKEISQEKIKTQFWSGDWTYNSAYNSFWFCALDLVTITFPVKYTIPKPNQS